MAVVGGAATLSAVIATSRPSYTSIALAGGWALATSAANPSRRPRTRLLSAAGAALIATATADRRKVLHQCTSEPSEPGNTGVARDRRPCCKNIAAPG